MHSGLALGRVWSNRDEPSRRPGSVSGGKLAAVALGRRWFPSPELCSLQVFSERLVNEKTQRAAGEWRTEKEGAS